MDTFRDMILQYRDVQNVVLIFASIGALAVLYIIVKIIWLICSGGVKLEATLTDMKQDKKIRAQEKEIERLNNEVDKLQGFEKELDEIKEKMGQR